MGTTIRVQASDGHELDAYMATPEGTPKGAVVICPEIFGINAHIRAVVDEYAAAGYLACAPALFDRVERNYETGYEQKDIQAGIAIMQKLTMTDAIADTQAAVEHMRTLHDHVAIVGYCWGGTVAWVAAGHIPHLSAAVAYYPGGIIENAELRTHCPTMLHLGEADKSPPADAVRQILGEHPAVFTYFYDAGHGFNCDHRPSYSKEAADLALARTLDFLGIASTRWLP